LAFKAAEVCISSLWLVSDLLDGHLKECLSEKRAQRVFQTGIVVVEISWWLVILQAIE
jgi:hypothetical protein